MTIRRVVVWVREDSWQATIDAASLVVGGPGTDRSGELVLLHVADTVLGEAARGAFGGLLGRGAGRRDPGEVVERLARDSSHRILADAARRAGRPVRTVRRAGRVEREVVAACEGADVLVCARDGDRSRLGPHSVGRHTRFVVDHAPCAVLLIWPEVAPGLGSIPPPPQRPPGHPPPTDRLTDRSG